jgi:hypothetical protein
MRSNEEIDMKRIAKKKLELDTETIRRLAGADLAAAIGGSLGGGETTVHCSESCDACVPTENCKSVTCRCLLQ